MSEPRENADEREPNTSAFREPNTTSDREPNTLDLADPMADEREPNTPREPNTEAS
jgi:hypothetical protein